MTLEEQIPDFNGQSVAFYVASAEGLPSWLSDGVVLDSPTLQKQGGRIFVVGRTTHDTDDQGESSWFESREAGLAWESVVYYIAIPSEEYYEMRRREDESVAKFENSPIK